MLECAIPECTCGEKFLRSGSLHLVDLIRADGTIAKRMIWLCGECTSKYSVQTWRPAGEQIRLREPACEDVANVHRIRNPRPVMAERARPKRPSAAATHSGESKGKIQLASAG